MSKSSTGVSLISDYLIDTLLDEAGIDFSVIEAILKPTLNQDLWDGENLRPEVRKTLLTVAHDFLEGLRKSPVSQKQAGMRPRKSGIIVNAKDIIIAGSSANYNYTKKSDIDLHIVVDFKEVDPDLPVVTEFFADLVALFNEHHCIKIYGYPVELYVQNLRDKDSPLVSNGLFSVMNNKWKHKPSHKEPDIDYKYVQSKAAPIMTQIDKMMGQVTKDPKGVHPKLLAMRTRLRTMRSSGLQRSGEFSVENLAWKLLRNKGYIQKMIEAERKSYDLSVTLK